MNFESKIYSFINLTGGVKNGGDFLYSSHMYNY